MLQDGKSLLIVDARKLRLLDITNPERPVTTDLAADFRGLALAPDGKTVAIEGSGLQMMDVAMKKVIRETAIPDGHLLCYSPDGRTLAFGAVNGVVRLYDTLTLRERAVLDGGVKQAVVQLQVAFSPDGQLLASCAMDSRINVWEVASGRLRRRIERKESRMDALAFSPDGRFLAFGGADKSVSIQDVVSGNVVHTFRGHAGPVSCLEFTPDGRRLLSGSSDTTVLVWDMQAVPAPKTKEVKRTAKELDALWERLAGDALQADEALRDLAASPAAAVELLAGVLKPAQKGRAERIGTLIGGLDSDQYAEREQASADLEKLGEEAVEPLRELLTGKPSAEQKRRAENLLHRLQSKEASPERLRSLRAVQLLEWLGTPEARRVLEKLAAGAPEAEQTRLAAGALAQLKKR